VLLVLGSWSTPALGEAPAEWLEHYEVTPACPGPAPFRAMVLRRIVARPEALARMRVRVHIALEPGAATLLGRVSTLDPAGEHLSREVTDTSCDALALALSLVVALNVDDAAGVEETARGESLATERTPRAPGDGWGADPSALADESDEDSGAAATSSYPLTSFQLEPLLRAAIQSGIAPALATGLGAGVALEWEGQGFWRPRVELVGMAFDGPSMALPLVSADIDIGALIVNTSLCPLELASREPWSLRPCFDLDAGRLTASGTGSAVTRPGERHAPWLSSGVSLHAGIAPWHGPVQLSAALGGFLPIFRHEFYFAPDIKAFEVPVAGWRASAGLALTF
jgi:hypothetical protein